MLTITAITTFLGAIAGFVPAILQFFTVKSNNAHTERLRELELQAVEKGYTFQLNLESSRADTEQQKYIYSFAAQPSGVRWVDALAVLVRPTITFSIFSLWWALKLAVFVAAVNGGLNLAQILPLVWTEADSAMLGSIIGFWFGNRAGSRGMAATMAVTRPTPVKAEKAKDTRTIIPDPPGSR